MIKAQSLEATLPTINFIHDVYMSLLEQDHQEGAGVQERYEMYENATRCSRTLLLCYVQERYKNATQLEVEVGNDKEYEMDGIRNIRKEVRSRPPTGDLPLRYSFSFHPFTATG